jgi:hypothetical protein
VRFRTILGDSSTVWKLSPPVLKNATCGISVSNFLSPNAVPPKSVKDKDRPRVAFNARSLGSPERVLPVLRALRMAKGHEFWPDEVSLADAALPALTGISSVVP